MHNMMLDWEAMIQYLSWTYLVASFGYSAYEPICFDGDVEKALNIIQQRS